MLCSGIGCAHIYIYIYIYIYISRERERERERASERESSQHCPIYFRRASLDDGARVASQALWVAARSQRGRRLRSQAWAVAQRKVAAAGPMHILRQLARSTSVASLSRGWCEGRLVALVQVLSPAHRPSPVSVRSCLPERGRWQRWAGAVLEVIPWG